MEEKSGILERAARLFDLPGQTVGLPRVELIGSHELRVENHRGILAYDEEEIVVGGGKLMIRVKGSGLTLGSMWARELVITGTVTAVELE